MIKNMKAFMKEDLKSDTTVEYPGVKTFTDEDGKPIPFIIKRLSRNRINEIREMYRTSEVYRDRKNGGRPVIGTDGQVAVLKKYDSEKAGRHIMVEAFVQPKLDDPDMMDFYGVYDKLDMPGIIFGKAEDMEYANKCLMEACRLTKSDESEKKVIDEIKN